MILPFKNSRTNICSVDEADKIQNQKHWNKPPVNLSEDFLSLRIGEVGQELSIVCGQSTALDMFVEL